MQLLLLVGDGHGIDGALQGGEFHGVLVVRARAHAADAHLKEVGKCTVEPVRSQRVAHGAAVLAVSGEGVVERVRLGAGRARGRYARAEAAQRRQNQQRADRKRAGAVDDRLLDLAEVKYPQFARAVSAPRQPVDDDTQPVKQQQRARHAERERARHIAQAAPRIPEDGKRVRSGEQRRAQHERRSVDGGGALLFRALGRLREQHADLLAHDFPAEDERGQQLDRKKAHGRPPDGGQGERELVPNDAEPDEPRRDEADDLRNEQRRRQADGQRDETRAQILRQQHAEELAPLHAQHEVHAEFVPPPCELKAVGVVYEEKQNEQRQPIQHRNERQQPVYGAALHALEEHHHILMRQGEDDVKRDDRDEQGREKQPVFPAAAAAVARNKFREHSRCPLPAAP